MNKRRRYGAKRRRREAKLKQMWLSGGLTRLQLFARLNGRVDRTLRCYVSERDSQILRPRDLHQERADREGITRREAKARNYGALYGLTPRT